MGYRRRRGGVDPVMLRRGGAAPPAPATFDFTAGGLIPAANCVQAFDPYIVQDLAQSYVDLGPHGNNAIVTVPPTLAAGGWQFNGVDQFVDSGIVIQPSYSIAVKFVYNGIPATASIFGSFDGWILWPLSSVSQFRIYYARSSRYFTIDYGTDGVAVCSGAEYDPDGDPGSRGIIYYYGDDQTFNSVIGGDEGLFYAPQTLIGAAYRSGYPVWAYANCMIARWAVYDIPLSAVQAAALSAAMAVS